MSDRRPIDRQVSPITFRTAELLSQSPYPELLISVSRQRDSANSFDIEAGAIRLNDKLQTALPVRSYTNGLREAGLIDTPQALEFQLTGKKPAKTSGPEQPPTFQLTTIGTAAINGLRVYGEIMLPAHFLRVVSLAQEGWVNAQEPRGVNLLTELKEQYEEMKSGLSSDEQLLVPAVYRPLALQSQQKLHDYLSVLSREGPLSRYAIARICRDKDMDRKEVGETELDSIFRTLIAAGMADLNPVEDKFHPTVYGLEATRAFKAFDEPIHEAFEAEMERWRKLSEQGE